MYTEKKRFMEEFIFNREKYTCFTKGHNQTELCSKYDVAPGVQTVVVLHQNNERNFMHLSADCTYFSPSMIVLPDAKVAIEITESIHYAFAESLSNWSDNEKEKIEQYKNGRVFRSSLDELNNAVKAWLCDDILRTAKNDIPITAAGRARRDAFEVFVQNKDKASAVESEKNQCMFNSDSSYEFFSSELIADFLLHNADAALRHQWSERLLEIPSIQEHAKSFLNWCAGFEAAFIELQALPEGSNEKQYRNLLNAIQGKNSVLAEYYGITCKIKTNDLRRAVLESNKDNNPKIAWNSNLHLNDLKAISFRNKVIWERNPIG